MRDDGYMVKLTVRRGSLVVAKIKDHAVELTDDFSVDGQLVRSIVHMGVPIPNELREGRWRIQVEDPDFASALKDHLLQYGLEVE